MIKDTQLLDKFRCVFSYLHTVIHVYRSTEFVTGMYNKIKQILLTMQG